MNDETAPYSPPDAWVSILREVGDCERPRLLVSLSVGRGSYRTILDLSPGVSRVDVGGTEVHTLHLGDDYPPASVLDSAAALYSDAAGIFLDTRRAAGSAYCRVGRLRLQLLDGDAERQQTSHGIAREAFGADDLSEGPAAPNNDALKVLENHSKTVGSQFITLAKQAADAARQEREGILEYARGALELTKEAGEYRAAALAALAEAERGSFLESPAGQALVSVAVEQIPVALGLAKLALEMRAAARAEKQTLVKRSGPELEQENANAEDEPTHKGDSEDKPPTRRRKRVKQHITIPT